MASRHEPFVCDVIDRDNNITIEIEGCTKEGSYGWMWILTFCSLMIVFIAVFRFKWMLVYTMRNDRMMMIYGSPSLVSRE